MDERDKRIGQLEVGQALVSQQVEQLVASTTRIERQVVDGFRAIEDREADRDNARTAAEATIVAARWEALKDPRTQVMIIVLALGLFAPQALPIVLGALPSIGQSASGASDVPAEIVSTDEQ